MTREPRADDEFFVGYDERVPPRLSRSLSTIAAGLGLFAAGAAAILAAGHVPLEGGSFEFGHPRPIIGTLATRPVASVRLDGTRAGAWIPLVAPGKHGADSALPLQDGARVTFDGTRIVRGHEEMLEMMPETVRASDPANAGLKPRATGANAAPEPPVTPERRGAGDEPRAETSASPLVTLVGEIVDSKCFLGVMVPGSGTTHHECAALCLRGGIPPALFVQDRAGRSALLLLTGSSELDVRRRAVALAGTFVAIDGRLTRQGAWRILESDPSAWRPLAR